ncbi:MAG: hypothetical protein UU72_C0008G0050, partial [candidate division WWE3 bacterium GW2011_GWB1_41_6]
YDYYYKSADAPKSYTGNYIETEEGKILYILHTTFYGLAWGIGFYAIRSIIADKNIPPL